MYASKESIVKKSKLFKGILPAIIIIALGAPTYATADVSSDLHGISVTVSYADLNLDQYDDAETFYRHLELASKQACDVQGWREAGSLSRFAEGRQCYRETLSGAVTEINNDQLTQIHNN